MDDDDDVKEDTATDGSQHDYGDDNGGFLRRWLATSRL